MQIEEIPRNSASAEVWEKNSEYKKEGKIEFTGKIYEKLSKQEEGLEEDVKKKLTFLDKKMDRRIAIKTIGGIFASLFLNNCGTRLAEKAVTELIKTDALEKKEYPEIDMELQEKIKSYIEVLRIYKSLGFEVKAEKGIGSTASSIITSEVVSKYIEKTNVYDFSDPHEQIERTVGIEKDIVPELRQKNVVEVIPFAIIEKKMAESKYKISIQNWLDEKHPIMHQKEYGTNEYMQAAEEIQRYINGYLAQFSYIEKKIDDLPIDPEVSKNWEYAINIRRDINIQVEDQKTIQSMLNVNSLKLDLLVEGKESDILRNGYKMKSDFLKKSKNHPLEINGKVTTIQFMIPYEKLPLSEQKKERGSKNFTDSFGNFVNLLEIKAYGGKPLNRNYIIHPRTRFGRTINAREVMESIEFELPGSGIEEPIKELIYTRVEQPLALLGENDKYGIYSNMDHKEVKHEFESKFEIMIQGVEKAEELFGQNEVKNIYITNAKEKNAFFHLKDPDTIYLHNTYLKDSESFDTMKTTFHETVHLIDKKLKLAENPEIQLLFTDIEKKYLEFFNEINESNFLENSFGGHAQDDESEFLASFLNTLNHPQWEKRIDEHSQKFKEQYKKTLKDLGEIFKKIEGIPTNAKIYNVFKEKSEFLKI